MLQTHGVSERITRSPSPRRRVVIRISDIAISAVASVSTPGVFVNQTVPRLSIAFVSTLL